MAFPSQYPMEVLQPKTNTRKLDKNEHKLNIEK